MCLAESSSLSRELSLSCVKYVGDEWKSSGEERMEAANEGNLNWERERGRMETAIQSGWLKSFSEVSCSKY